MDDKQQRLLKITQGGFYVNSAVWVVLGGLTWLRAKDPMMVLVLCVLAIGNAIALAWVGWGLGRGKRLFYVLGAGLIALNFILSLTDEFGLMDLVVLLLNGGLLVLLFMVRKTKLA